MSVVSLFPVMGRSSIRGVFFGMVFLLQPYTVLGAIDNNTTNAPADVVVGQQDFVSNAANQGGSVGGNGFNQPYQVSTADGKMFTVDIDNHRVLIFNTIPTLNNTFADVVIGQTDLFSRLAGATQNKLTYPMGLFTDGIRLFIGDQSNSRILIFNSIPTSNNALADVVIGQVDFTQHAVNQGGEVGPNTISLGMDVHFDGAKLFVVDKGNNRILIFNSIPTSNNASADIVIGQVDFTQNAANQGGSVGANTLNAPRAVFSDGEKLYIADGGNNRILIYNSIPTINNTSADVVIGQVDFTQNTANQGGSVTANTLNLPIDIYLLDNKLFIADFSNHRVLAYSVPTTNNASADLVIGQPSFTTNAINQNGSTTVAGANTLYYPRGVWSDNNQLFIADQHNKRVLIYTLIRTPTNFISSSQTTDSITLSVDSFATVFGTAKYFFSRSDGINSGWIDTPTWIDTGLSENTNYVYTVQYGTGDGIESETVSLTVRTAGPPPGGGRGSRSPGRGGDAPKIDTSKRTLLPEQSDTVSPLYLPSNNIPPAPAGVTSPMRARLAARIEKRIAQYPRLRTLLLKVLERVDRRLLNRIGN